MDARTFRPPTFDEWLDYAFSQGSADFTASAYGDRQADERLRQIECIEPLLLAEYLIRLFERPRQVAERYDDDLIAEGVRFIFGSPSGWIGIVAGASIDASLKARCFGAVATLYTDLFDHVCGRRGSEPDAELCSRGSVDAAVFMIWDMGGIELSVLFPKDRPYLVEPSLRVLSAALLKCRTAACRQSALHGLGHVIGTHAMNGERAIADRAVELVDVFLRTVEAPAWLREYAGRARVGAVQ